LRIRKHPQGQGNDYVAKKPKPIPLPAHLLEQTQLLANALNNEADLPCALIATSFLEHCLASLLQAFLIDSETAKELIQPGRPLGKFVTRAKVAYCLGIIPKSMLQEITKIADIRNQFAHNFSDIRFSDQEIAAMCNRLDSHLDPSVLELTKTGKMEWNPRANFERTLYLLVNELLELANKIDHCKPHPGKNGDWIISRGLHVDAVREE
jgi:DNA-binding MltR family transcriptional regulator